MELTAILIAALSLGLSGYTIVRQRLENREASLEVRLEEYFAGWLGGRLNTHVRVVVVNHGPSVANDVTVELLDADHQQWGGHWRPPHGGLVPRLHPGQDYPAEVIREYGRADPAVATVGWADRRAGRQQIDVWLTARLVS